MDKQPNHLKLLHGNPGKRKLIQEMKPTPKVPPMPYIVRHNRYAKAEWNRITPILADLGVVSEIDQAALSALCMAVAHTQQLERHLNTLEVGGEEYLRVSRAMRQSTIQMNKFLCDFGMTPKSRKRVTPLTNETVENEFDQWELNNK